ncbi:hypothetical protein RBWH47_03852 [Rhodopirellula baltica WH47]|uniref:Uncharacterized protein n=1 Tax=Rhodopirellula baltica WH47 TaxID=991778 RepID=F2AK66_RHOBT|nr:hypothetical protein RBWH47_03852 [Rhodopirellula baltica WH47]
MVAGIVGIEDRSSLRDGGKDKDRALKVRPLFGFSSCNQLY